MSGPSPEHARQPPTETEPKADQLPIVGRATPWREFVLEGGLFSSGFLSLGATAGILLVLLVETWSFFSEVSFSEFFLDTQWTPLFVDKHFGVWPLVCGTFLTSLVAISVALPFGLMAAIYLSEFASSRVRKLLKPMLEVLAGVPTIVFGYFALIFMTPLLQKIVPGLAGFNALGPGIVMGFMIIPMISSLGEDALHAVPTGLKEGAYALGASKLSAVFRVTIPSAFSGIGAAVILAISRAIGETMIVTIAAGQQPRFTLDPRVPIETMTAYIVQISLGDTPTGTIEYKTIFAVGAALFLMTFGMNLFSQRLAKKYRDRESA